MKNEKRIEELRGLFTPHNKHITLVLDEALTETETGLHLPEVNQAEIVTGQVIECADDCEFNIEPGKRVYFNSFAAQKLSIGKDLLLIVQSENIVGTVHSNAQVQEVSS